ncbi:MAG: cation diffusion facilitator family transporter [Chloroflexota bacterium]
MRRAFVLSLAILLVELAGGLASHSLALLSDAGHMLTDVAALGLSWYAVERAKKPSTGRRTFGYSRTGVLAAQANAITLMVIVGVIAYEAIRRLAQPPTVTPTIMFLTAAVGLLANLIIGNGLRHASEHNINVRGALLHVMGDAAASAAVIVGGIVILITRWYAVDAVLSLLIGLLIAWGAWRLLTETTNILMEGTPRGLDTAAMIDAVTAIPGVRDLHDLHVWSIDGHSRSLSAHLLVDDQTISESDRLQTRLHTLLHDDFGIDHATVQLECAACGRPGVFCTRV